jgi:hypothetical protein
MSKDTVNKYVKEYDEKKAALLASAPDVWPGWLCRLIDRIFQNGVDSK